SGQPEMIIEIKKKGVVLIVECKSDKDKHRTAELNKPASHNLDGVLYYAKYFKESFTVLFLAITGDAEKEKELTEEKVDLRSITKDLHNRLRVIKFGNKAKPLFIGACLLALRDDDFYKKVAEANFDKEEDIPNLLKNALNSKKSLGLKEYGRLKEKLQELIDSNSHLLIKQKKKEHRLSSILKKIQEEVYPLLKTSSTDIISEFYYEFLRYSPGDGKGLGIVLTPSHIAELFCDLVNLGPDDKILDICCGTGTFLVMALNKVFKKEEIKDNLYGVESDDEIYHLLWINMILHGDGSSHISQTSCFDENKKTEGQTMIEPILEKVGFTVGFLNPPYSQPDYNEAKFILHLLKFIEKGQKAVVITHMKVARGTKPLEKERKELLENHTLKAVMTMPGDLFYGTQNDGHEIKDNKREEREKENYKQEKEEEYISTSQLFTPEQSEKSWLPEFYLPVNFSKVKEEQFMESVRDYLGYIMTISKGIDNLPTSLPKLFEELENNQPESFSLNIEKWKEFKLVSNYNQDKENGTDKKGLFHAEPAPKEDNFRTKSAKPYFQDLKQTIPLISNSGKNNGCVGFVEKIILETPAKDGCITLGGFGTFFYQPIGFYRTYAQDGNVWVLRAE
ncbi:31098_t:CDS:2, partial [Racocetra persica]